MKFLKILLSAMLLMASSLTLATESIEIVVPEHRDTVNARGFTFVAKAQVELDVYPYMVQIVLFNDENGLLQDAYVYPTGTSYSAGPASLEIISPKPSDLDLDDTTPQKANAKLPIVVHVRNLIEGDPYYVEVHLWRWPDTAIVGDYVIVQTK